MKQNFSIEESQRQLILRGLAVQAIRAPGFTAACLEVAEVLQGDVMFRDLVHSMMDRECDPSEDMASLLRKMYGSGL